MRLSMLRAAVVVCLLLAPAARAGDLPRWLVEASEIPVPDHSPEAGAVILLDEQSVRVKPDGTIVATGHRVTSAGDRRLIPVSPLLGLKQHPFRHAQRKYPVSFAYPYRVSDDIVVSLPAGMHVETVPGPRNETGAGLEYSLACSAQNGTTLHVRRDFRVDKCDYPVSSYAQIRAFSDRVRAGDEEQVVLSGAEK